MFCFVTEQTIMLFGVICVTIKPIFGSISIWDEGMRVTSKWEVKFFIFFQFLRLARLKRKGNKRQRILQQAVPDSANYAADSAKLAAFVAILSRTLLSYFCVESKRAIKIDENRQFRGSHDKSALMTVAESAQNPQNTQFDLVMLWFYDQLAAIDFQYLQTVVTEIGYFRSTTAQVRYLQVVQIFYIEKSKIERINIRLKTSTFFSCFFSFFVVLLHKLAEIIWCTTSRSLQCEVWGLSLKLFVFSATIFLSSFFWSLIHIKTTLSENCACWFLNRYNLRVSAQSVRPDFDLVEKVFIWWVGLVVGSILIEGLLGWKSYFTLQWNVFRSYVDLCFCESLSIAIRLSFCSDQLKNWL